MKHDSVPPAPGKRLDSLPGPFDKPRSSGGIPIVMHDNLGGQAAGTLEDKGRGTTRIPMGDDK